MIRHFILDRQPPLYILGHRGCFKTNNLKFNDSALSHHTYTKHLENFDSKLLNFKIGIVRSCSAAQLNRLFYIFVKSRHYQFKSLQSCHLVLLTTFSVSLISCLRRMILTRNLVIFTIWFRTPRFHGFYCTIWIGTFIWFAPIYGFRGICINVFCLQDVLKWVSEDISIVYWEWDL
jgi:hypothetical protein